MRQGGRGRTIRASRARSERRPFSWAMPRVRLQVSASLLRLNGMGIPQTLQVRSPWAATRSRFCRAALYASLQASEQ